MYYFDTVKTANQPWFDSLFCYSLPAFDEGSINWDEIGLLEHSYESKKYLLVEKINKILGAGGIGIYVTDSEGTVIRFLVGTITSKENKNYLVFLFDLIGKDYQGSRAWLYQSDFLEAFKNYTQTTFAVTGHIAKMLKHNRHYAFFYKRNAEIYTLSVEGIDDNNVDVVLEY